NWRESKPDLNEDFNGQIDEVRVWSVERSEQEIQEAMFKKLTGKEPGLVSLWNFDSATDGVVPDMGPAGHHALLKGNARIVERDQSITSIARMRVLSLDGLNSFVDLGTNGVKLSPPFTEEVWIRPTLDMDTNFHGILGGTRSGLPEDRAP